MKKLFSILLSMVMIFAMACQPVQPQSDESSMMPTTQQVTTPVKMGLICLHDENSTYDLNFIRAFKAACESQGVEYLIKTPIPESNECYLAARELIDEGCTLIFADSFGHEDYLLNAAKEFPQIQFCHATGTHAHTEKLSNFHNAFASIYEGRFLAGVAAGMKLNEMGETKMGYVGAFSYAEVISGYTSFYLGAKSVCPDATMEVMFTGSWYDMTKENEAAAVLINNGCKLISQHADSMGAPNACELASVPNVSYNGSTVEACPNTFIVSSRINWEPYFLYLIDCMKNNKPIDTDWVGTMANGAVELTAINEKAAAEGTAAKIEEVKKLLADGELHVFDTSAFTVKGEKVESYLADVDTDANYTPDTEVIKDGYFAESTYRSAPYFDLQIDGITLLNTAY